MPPRKQQPSASRARLTVLASADDEAFLAYALKLLRSKQRLDREAALEALIERPLDGAHQALCDLYMTLHADRPKSDGGALLRGAIIRCLLKQPRASDASVGVLASETFEKDSNRDDNTYGLRLLGLQLLALTLPGDELRYYAVEHLNDTPCHLPHVFEPATTAMRLLSETGNHLGIYQWLLNAERESPSFLTAFEALSDGPPLFVARFIAGQIEGAIARMDEPACTVFAEAIIKLEIEQAYPAISRIMDSRVSDELFTYLAVLLASTHRAALLSVLEQQLRPGGRSKLVLEALRVRTTPEQQAIIDRWENRE